MLRISQYLKNKCLLAIKQMDDRDLDYLSLEDGNLFLSTNPDLISNNLLLAEFYHSAKQQKYYLCQKVEVKNKE